MLYLGEEIIFSLYELMKNIQSGLLLGMTFELQVELFLLYVCMCFLILKIISFTVFLKRHLTITEKIQSIYDKGI